MTMLVTWIVELFLNTLGRLKEQGQDETYEYESTQEKFRKFMASMRIKVFGNLV